MENPYAGMLFHALIVGPIIAVVKYLLGYRKDLSKIPDPNFRADQSENDMETLMIRPTKRPQEGVR
jgi:hypothetical protein